MTNEQYIENALRTESQNSFAVPPRIEHGVLGVSTEAGEMLNNLKRAKFYGNNVDIRNLKEEIGDVFWYIAILCDELNVSMEELMEQNIKKLKLRYPTKFSKDASDNRDYGKEVRAASTRD